MLNYWGKIEELIALIKLDKMFLTLSKKCKCKISDFETLAVSVQSLRITKLFL